MGANKERFGEVLKKEIESGLKTFVDNVCNGFIEGTIDEVKQERQEAYLLLVRQFIRQLVVRYEYQVSQVEERVRS